MIPSLSLSIPSPVRAFPYASASLEWSMLRGCPEDGRSTEGSYPSAHAQTPNLRQCAPVRVDVDCCSFSFGSRAMTR
jgi:hypothetical protein